MFRADTKKTWQWYFEYFWNVSQTASAFRKRNRFCRFAKHGWVVDCMSDWFAVLKISSSLLVGRRWVRSTEWRDQKISSRPIPRLFFETKIFETETKTFLRDQIFLRLRPRLFFRPKFSRLRRILSKNWKISRYREVLRLNFSMQVSSQNLWNTMV